MTKQIISGFILSLSISCVFLAQCVLSNTREAAELPKIESTVEINISQSTEQTRLVNQSLPALTQDASLINPKDHNPENPRKLMTFSGFDWQDVMSRLDYIDEQLRLHPEMKVMVLVYGAKRGDTRGEPQARIRCMRNYLINRRGVERSRLKLRFAGYNLKSETEFWSFSTDDYLPQAKPTVSPRAVIFLKGRIENWESLCNN